MYYCVCGCECECYGCGVEKYVGDKFLKENRRRRRVRDVLRFRVEDLFIDFDWCLLNVCDVMMFDECFCEYYCEECV